jgi:Tol biopolymer transport system component
VLKKRFDPKGVAISALNKKSLSETEIGASVKLIPNAAAPAWSPDGKWIAYIDPDITNQGIYITTPDLSEKFLVYKPTVGKNLQTYPLSWAPNSKWLTFGLSDGSLWIIDITGNGLRQLTGPGLNISPVWSKHR